MEFGYGHTTYHGARDARDTSGNRVKAVFANSMVAHLWANQSQMFARSGNGNFYFEGRALFSYGSHYVAGYLMPDGVALINAESRSHSTSQHIGDAYGATRHLTRHSIPDLTALAAYCYSPLPRLESGDAAARKRARAEIRAHVERYALQFESEAAVYLLSIASERNPTRAYVRAIANFNRKAARAKAAADKRQREERLALASRVAATPESRFPEYLAQFAGRYDESGRLRLFAKDIFHAQRAANAAARTAQGRKTGRLLKLLRARIADLDRRAAQIAWNRHTRGQVSHIRDAAPKHAAGSLSGSWAYRQFRDAARWILDHGAALGGLKRATFESIAADAEAIRERLAAEEARVYQEKREREARERFAREAAARAAWLAGASGYWRGSDETGGALLRAVRVERDESGAVTAGTLQTSHGADVPLPHAVRAFRFLKLCRETGRAWESNGRTIRVGHFRVDRVEPSGDFKAGCHVIHWPEVERVARALGVFDAPADESALTPSHVAA